MREKGKPIFNLVSAKHLYLEIIFFIMAIQNLHLFENKLLTRPFFSYPSCSIIYKKSFKSYTSASKEYTKNSQLCLHKTVFQLYSILSSFLPACLIDFLWITKIGIKDAHQTLLCFQSQLIFWKSNEKNFEFWICRIYPWINLLDPIA